MDGLTKLDKTAFSTKEESQAESFRKMLWPWRAMCVSSSSNWLTRMHNMRTMDAMAPPKAGTFLHCA